jgi:hypothetical protein
MNGQQAERKVFLVFGHQKAPVGQLLDGGGFVDAVESDEHEDSGKSHTKDPELLMDILKFGADCKVIAPKELRERVSVEVKRMLENG